MKGTIKLYRNDGSTNGNYPVKLILSHNRKTRRRTIAYSKELKWNEDRQLPLRSHPDYENLYAKIDEFWERIDTERFRSMDDFDLAFSYVMQSIKKEIDFFTYGEQRAVYMESKKNPQTGNARAYRTALNELRKFKEVVFFKDITPEFLHGFKEYKEQQGQTNSTIRAYLYACKAIYTAAVDNGVIKDAEPFKKVFKSIPKTRRNEEVAYMERSEITKLEEAEFKKKEYNRARDLCLLQFYLGGLDFMDLCYLKKSRVKKDQVTISRAKLGKKKYDFNILLPKKAKIIMERYKGEDPIYYFDFPREEKAYILFRGSTYRYLKRIQRRLKIELKPLNKTMNLKTMRRSFRTIGKHLFIQEDIIREIMGHEKTDVPNLYFAKYKAEDRDKAHMQIIA